MYNMMTIDNGFIVYGNAQLDELEVTVNEAFQAATAGKRSRILLIDFFVNLNMAGGKVPSFFYSMFRYDDYTNTVDYDYCAKEVTSSDCVDVIKQMTNEGYEYVCIMQISQIKFMMLYRKPR